MKNAILKAITFTSVFIAALFIISSVMNKGNTDMTAEMSEASLPMMYVNMNGTLSNCLHGYTTQMDTAYFRDTITPMGKDRTLSVQVAKMGTSINKISFEVRSVDGKRLVESTEITDYQESTDSIKASFTVKDLIDPDTEYILVFLIETESGQNVRYYTRMIMTDTFNVQEKLNFVTDFSAKTFNKDAAAAITKYLEPNSEGDNTTYNKVNIHSSFDQITWGGLSVKQVTDPVVDIKEIAKDTGSFIISYVVSVPENGKTNYYNVEEYFRIRYSSSRTYLLEYERTMTQMFDEESDSFTNNKIVLGINNSDLNLVENDSGNVFAFVNEGNLYSYNITNNAFIDVFGFYNNNNIDLRDIYQQHQIDILSVDETGNITFMVYGYMNRGRHEGEVGVQVCYYDSSKNTVEEEIYIPYNKSYAILKNEIQQLRYVNKTRILYVLLDETLYGINLTDKSYTEVATNLVDGSFKVSKSNLMIAWQTGTDVYSSSSLVLMNLNTQSISTINADTGCVLAPLGFMGEDLIYGITRTSDIYVDSTGMTVFPMYQIKIQNEENEILKEYHEDGVYIVGCTLKDNQMQLSRVVKAASGLGYTATGDDQIVNIEDTVVSENTVETATTQNFEKVVQIAAKSNIDNKTLKVLTPKEVLFEGGRELKLEPTTQITNRFYVYEKGEVTGIYTNPATAVNKAYDAVGVVVNDLGQYVFMRGNRNTKNQIMAFTETSITAEKNSIAICLDAILKFEGISRNTEDFLNQGKTPIEILQSNLTDARILDLSGCSLDAVLYYVNRELPVMAILDDGNAVLIVGFNELNTVIMDPVTGTIYKMGINDSTNFFEANGNHFITYIKN